MIDFNYIADFQLIKEVLYANWVVRIVQSEGKIVGNINYIFCGDAYLLEINRKYLNHDTYTDIITFDYTEGSMIGGDIFISVERINENAIEFGVGFEEELRRVMSHGILHLAGYGDKGEGEIRLMRAKEEEKMNLFHVEQN